MTRSAKHKTAKATSAKAASPMSATTQQTHEAIKPFADNTPEDAPLLILHVVRILALYLYVLLARNPQPNTISLNDIFFPETKTMELLVESTASNIEQQVHAALLACVQGEIASNQFDGLIQEKTVFAAIKRIFRQQKVQVKTQCRLLVRLLNGYLAQLAQAPIVRCESISMLASTLEYLARGDTSQSKKEPVAASLLYPLVNAIDSLSIEQRECLDALTTLWRWLDACDPSKMLLDRIILLHHKVVFFLEPTESSKAPASTMPSSGLGACFARTLVSHADHIFRHDLDFTDPQDLLSSDSETEDDSSSMLLPLSSAPSTPPPKQVSAPTFSPSKSKTKTLATVEKVTTPTARKEDEPDVSVIDANEPMPANMMRVGIAAAAGTLAAALCVIFT